MARNREIKASVPYLEVSEASCGEEVESNWFRLIWNYENIITSDFILNSDGTVTINKTGLYLLYAQVGVSTTQVGDCALCFCDGYEEIEYAVTEMTLTANYKGNMILTKTALLHSGDLISVRFYRSHGNISILESGHSRFRISYVPMGGWNNNNGGNIVNRGIRR